MNYLGLVSSSNMLSGKVFDKLGESYGTIKELLVDPSTGKIAMAVLGFGGVLGMGDTTRLIPWASLQMNPNTFDFQISIDKKILEDAPAMDAKDITDHRRISELYKYYGLAPYWEDTQNFDTADPVYKSTKPNDHQQYEGSHQITQPVLSNDNDNRFDEEVDLDKIRGQKPSHRVDNE